MRINSITLAVLLVVGLCGCSHKSTHTANERETGCRFSYHLDGDYAFSFAWQPDGNMLSWVRMTPKGRAQSERYRIQTVNTSKKETVFTSNGTFDFGVTWAPDGARIIFIKEQNNDALLYSVNPLTQSGKFITNSGRYSLPKSQGAWLSRSELLYLKETKPSVYTYLAWNFRSGTTRTLWKPRERTTDPAVLPKGQLLAYIDKSDRDRVKVRSLLADRTLFRSEPRQGPVLDEAWEIPSKRLVYVSRSQAGDLLHVVDVFSSSDRVIAHVPKFFAPMSISEGKVALVSIDGNGTRRIEIYDIESGRCIAKSPPPHKYVQPSWSPDGSQLAFLAYDQRGSRVCIADMSSILKNWTDVQRSIRR